MNKRLLNRLEEIAYALVPIHRGDMRCFHVSGVFRKKRLVALGFNCDRTHPITIRHDYYPGAKLHAESSAILKSGLEDGKGHTICVLRVDRRGKLNMSRPCLGCFSLIQQMNFSRLYYTNKQGEWESEKL